jgi:hypothetical protein
MTDLHKAAQQALEYLGAPSAKLWPAGTQYRIIAALHAALAQQAEPKGGGRLPPPLQAEPVAWIHTDPDKPRVRFLEWREDEPGYRGRWVKTPLYLAPPQRKPLTEEEIDAATAQERDALLDHIYEYGTAAEGVLERIRKLCRAVERAHGIKE